MGSQFIEQHTSYVTTATPEEVKDFYTTMLPHYGWGGPSEGFEEGDNNDNLLKGIKYGWGAGDTHNLRYVGLDIIAKQEPDGRTKVSIKLHGTLP